MKNNTTDNSFFCPPPAVISWMVAGIYSTHHLKNKIATYVNSPTPMKKNGTILLIDDNKIELRLAEMAMKDVNGEHKCLSFNDPFKAWEYISTNIDDIFLIISDVKMQGMSGFDLLEKINADKYLKLHSIPFVFLTNSQVAKDIEMAYSLSPQGYFIKPLEMEQLCTMFKDMVNYWTDSQMACD